MTSQVSLKGMIFKLVILAGLWVVYLSQICLPSHRTRSDISPFWWILSKISYQCRWVPQKRGRCNRLVHSFIIFLAFVEEQERTPKPVFRSVLVKWHSL